MASEILLPDADLVRRCQAIVGGYTAADYLSGSARNMLRKGLALLFTRAIWTAPAA